MHFSDMAAYNVLSIAYLDLNCKEKVAICFAKPYSYNWSKIFTNALTTHNSVVMISIIKRE